MRSSFYVLYVNKIFFVKSLTKKIIDDTVKHSRKKKNKIKKNKQTKEKKRKEEEKEKKENKIWKK